MSSASASRPASRSASAANRPSKRATSWAARPATPTLSRTAAPPPSPSRPPSPTSVALIVAAPRAIASPCWAALRRARISSASPTRRPAASISAASCSASSSRRTNSRGSRASSRSAASLARQRLDGPLDCRALALQAAERVEQVALAALVEEPLLVVLAVDLDERPGDLGEARRGHGLVVEAGRRAAAGMDLAAQRRSRPGRSMRASTRATSAPWRTRPLSARAPRASPRASISRLLPAPVSPVSTFRPGPKRQVEPVDQGEVGDRQLEQPARPGGFGRLAAIPGRRSACASTAPSAGQQLHLVAEQVPERASRSGARRTGSGASRARDLDDVADVERDVVVAVDAHECLVRVDDPDPDRLERADDDRADRREVARDRGDDQVAAERVEDRAAGRERIAGRAGRARRRSGRRR